MDFVSFAYRPNLQDTEARTPNGRWEAAVYGLFFFKYQSPKVIVLSNCTVRENNR